MSIAKVVAAPTAEELGSPALEQTPLAALGAEKGYPRPGKLLDLSEPALIQREEGDDTFLYGLSISGINEGGVAVAGIQV